MPVIVVSAVAGLIFGLGLTASGMARPEIVLGFLDVFGAWNPALGFVMAGAVPVAAVGFAVARRMGRGVLETRLYFPSRKDVDAPLLIGAAVFGVGWGLAGVCPAPALTLAPRAPLLAAAFLAPMLLGLLLAPKIRRRFFPDA